MDTEHPAINDSGQGKEVEDLTAGLPDGSVSVLLLAFLVESVYLSDLARFMVTADKCDLVRESNLVSETTRTPLSYSILTLP